MIFLGKVFQRLSKFQQFFSFLKFEIHNLNNFHIFLLDVEDKVFFLLKFFFLIFFKNFE